MVALIRTLGISNDISVRVNGQGSRRKKARRKKCMQVDYAGGAAAPQHRTPTDPPHLLLAIGAKRHGRGGSARCEVHHTVGAAAPQQRKRSSGKAPGGCLDTISDLLPAGDPPS